MRLMPTRRPVRAALARFWADDHGLSVFSALLFVVVFVVPPLVPAGSGRSLAGDVVYFLLLVSGVHALGERRIARRVLMPVALVDAGGRTSAAGSSRSPTPGCSARASCRCSSS